MKPAPTKPNIFDFLDLVQFLHEHFTWRKHTNGLTYTEWCRELGIGSKTLLRFILQRRRKISDRTAHSFRANLSLDENEGKYFDLLLRYTQAPSAVERNALGKSLIALQKSRFNQSQLQAEKAAQDVLSPIILTLLTFKDFVATTENLCTALQQPLSVIQGALDGLTHHGLITLDEKKVYHFAMDSFQIPATDQNAHLRRFHQHWLERAIQAIDLPAETRKFRSLQFALTAEEFQTALEKINEFALSLLVQYHHQSLRDRRLYMFESAIFPISICM